MTISQVGVTRAVQAHLRARGATQKALAKALFISTTALSARLRGSVAWSLADVDALAGLGVIERPEWSARFDMPGGAA